MLPRPSAVALGLFAESMATGARLRGAAAPGAVILNYHSVGEPFTERIFPGNCVSTKLFAAQMRFLRRHCRPLPLARIEAGLRGEAELPRRGVAVTFDDGYRGVLTNALPILERHDIPATVFLPTDLIAVGAEKWDDRLSRVLMTTRREFVTVVEAERGERRFPLATNAERLAALRQLCQAAPKNPRAATEAWIDEIVAQCGAAPAPRRDALLSPAEVRALASHPLLSFGSHSAGHRHLAGLSPDELHHDLRRSRDQIEHWIDRPCRHFAYPYGQEGDCPTAASQVLAELGFTLAMTTIEGPASVGDDRFRLRRILAHPDDTSAIFRLKVMGAFDRYRKIRSSLRRLLHG